MVAVARGVLEQTPMATSVSRPSALYNRPGRPGRLGASKTTFYARYVYRGRAGEECIPRTNVPRLRLANVGPKITVAIDDEVDALIDALRREREKTLRAERAAATPPENSRQGWTKLLAPNVALVLTSRSNPPSDQKLQPVWARDEP